MFWVYVIGVVTGGSFVLRRVFRGRRAPQFDQKNLENADYARIQRDIHNLDTRWGDGSGH